MIYIILLGINFSKKYILDFSDKFSTILIWSTYRVKITRHQFIVMFNSFYTGEVT